MGGLHLAQIRRAFLRRYGGLLAALFPCSESTLLTGMMLTATTVMLFVQFPDNRALLPVNIAGYALLRWLNRPGGYISLPLSMLLTGMWFVLVTALPLLLMPGA